MSGMKKGFSSYCEANYIKPTKFAWNMYSAGWISGSLYPLFSSVRKRKAAMKETKT